MSAIIVVAPIIAASWPVLSTAAISAAASFGFSTVKGEMNDRKLIKEECIELEIEDSQVLKESLKERKQIVFMKDEIRISFYSDERGKCSMQVSGKNKSKDELRKIGTNMMNRVTQQYVYNKVVTELKHQGYTVASEEIKQNRTVRVLVRRFS